MKTTLLKTKLLTALLALMATLSSFAGVVSYDKDFTVSLAETKSVKLIERTFIKNIIVQAEGVREDSMVEVMVNGEVKGTIYAPGKDPSYVVTIAEETSSIEFRHHSGATMQIYDVLTNTVEHVDMPTAFDLQSTHGVDQLARTAIKLVDVLIPYSSLEEEKKYLLPIKKRAGSVFVLTTARGALNLKTQKALKGLAKSIVDSIDYLDDLLEREELFEYGIELMIVKESISELLY